MTNVTELSLFKSLVFTWSMTDVIDVRGDFISKRDCFTVGETLTDDVDSTSNASYIVPTVTNLLFIINNIRNFV